MSITSQESLNDNFEYSIKKYLTAHYVMPNKYKKLVSENILVDDPVFQYSAAIVRYSSEYSDKDSIQLNDEVKIAGEIVNIIKNSESDYIVEIKGSAKFTTEYFDYYGPKDSTKKRFSERIISHRIEIDLDRLNELETNSSLYFVGTTRKFSREELYGLTLDELGYLRNEFYARKGFEFKTAKMKNYFSKKSWFKPTTRDVKLTETELENVYLIRGMEQEINFGKNSSEADEINKIYEVSQIRLLTEDDLINISKHKLPYLRNTFFAKKGYIFNVLRYRDYFEAQNWYVGKQHNVDSLLSENDRINIRFIKSHE